MPRQRRDILVVVTSDPRSSPRPAEAVRIAAGLSAWKEATVTVYLAGPAVLSLSEGLALIDEEPLQRHLPSLAAEQQLRVEKDSPFLRAQAAALDGVPALTARELGRVAASCFSVLRF